ncbi:MAG: hypothetical protein VW520_04380, partial [Candidatus Puniceispirillum sp.]
YSPDLDSGFRHGPKKSPLFGSSRMVLCRLPAPRSAGACQFTQIRLIYQRRTSLTAIAGRSGLR